MDRRSANCQVVVLTGDADGAATSDGRRQDAAADAVDDELVDPDVPKRLLGPLRSLLWEPGATQALQRVTEITDRKLAHYCHALAA